MKGLAKKLLFSAKSRRTLIYTHFTVNTTSAVIYMATVYRVNDRATAERSLS